MNPERGYQLIDSLLADPVKFYKRGRVSGLLQAYADGFPMDTLRPLLQSDDVYVQVAAGLVVSELRSQAEPLLDDIVLLTKSPEKRVLYYAMESITDCTRWNNREAFGYVVSMLESEHDAVRTSAMELIGRVSLPQVEGALCFFEKKAPIPETHRQGLKTLIADDQVEPGVVSAMIQSSDPLVRRYGAIAARRVYKKFPELLERAQESDDPDVLEFAYHALQDVSGR